MRSAGNVADGVSGDTMRPVTNSGTIALNAAGPGALMEVTAWIPGEGGEENTAWNLRPKKEVTARDGNPDTTTVPTIRATSILPTSGSGEGRSTKAGLEE